MMQWLRWPGQSLSVIAVGNLVAWIGSLLVVSHPVAVGKTVCYFSFKPPIAVEADRTVFARDDPGHLTDQGLCFWRAAHRDLWAALRERGRRVPIGGHRPGRPGFAAGRSGAAPTVRHCQPTGSIGGPSTRRKYARTKQAVHHGIMTLLNSYGGATATLKRATELLREFEKASLGRPMGHKNRLQRFEKERFMQSC